MENGISFFGMNTTIDRASYQDSIYSPLSFEELSYLAREHLHKAYKIDQNGSIITNDQFLSLCTIEEGGLVWEFNDTAIRFFYCCQNTGSATE